MTYPIRQHRWLAALWLLAPSILVAADSQWVIGKSTITYHVSHTLHESGGVSHEARGKGVCHGGQCDFLIAVPVNSFKSGDTNRDLHMIQATRGAQFPIVSVRLSLPESALQADTIHCDLEVEFAGHTAHYKQVAIQRTTQGNESHIVGSIPATLLDFKIDPPSLLSIPVKNEFPVHVDITWRPL